MDISTLPLQAPSSPMAVYELLAAYEQVPMRALPAAFGICCPSLKLKVVFAGNVNKYGEAVFNELTKRGVAAKDIFGRGVEAFGLVSSTMERLPTGAEVDDREGFSAAGEPSTSS